MNIQILGQDFKVIDTKEKLTVADSFVKNPNKIGSGNGEAKFYIGNDNEELRNFFGNEPLILNCFLLKSDLIQYLKDTEYEYLNPEQEYRNKSEFRKIYYDRLNKVESIQDSLINFEIREQDQIEKPRIYVKSKDFAYDLIRELSLPNITYISVIKLLKNNELFFYFKLFADFFGEEHHPAIIQLEEQKIIESTTIPITEKTQLVKSRVGHGKYRKLLLEECPFCPITLVSDDRLLIASHIKPWVHSTDTERVDPKNGFMLTPTFDFLFDRGYISFSNDKQLLISPWISKTTCERLNIKPNKTYSMLPTEKREYYLDFHRNFIFKQ